MTDLTEVSSTLQRATVLCDLGRYDEAIRLLQEFGTTERLRQAYAQYSEFLERRGENARAFDMLKQAYKATAHSGASV